MPAILIFKLYFNSLFRSPSTSHSSVSGFLSKLYVYPGHINPWPELSYPTIYIYFFSMAPQPLVGQGLHIIEASRSQSVGFLWTSDQPDAETPNWQHTTLTRDRYRCHRWDSNPQSQQVEARNPTHSIARQRGRTLHIILHNNSCLLDPNIFLVLCLQTLSM